jgi:hypothetical protein
MGGRESRSSSELVSLATQNKRSAEIVAELVAEYPNVLKTKLLKISLELFLDLPREERDRIVLGR